MSRLVSLLAVVALLNLGSVPAQATPMPPDFHWGVSLSGFQSEGSAPDSNWRRYVEQGTSAIKHPYRDAVDFRHRYASDIELARQLGVNTFRFGVEWARVQPRPGVWDETELAYYDDVVAKVRAAGMTPMITLTHFVHPGWVVDQGGWVNPRTVTDWLIYARAIATRYRGLGALWITFNEPTQYRHHERQNGGVGVFQAGTMMTNLVAAHRAGFDVIHEVDPGSRVSSNIAYLPPPLQAFADADFLNRVRDKLDFVGIDYYYGLSLDNLTAIHGATGEFWKIAPQPDGIYYALKEYQRQYPHLPLYVVENGMPTDNGQARADGYSRSAHLRDHLYWVQRAMAEGVKVIGYNYWSLTDNYEWGDYRSRFGLYTVDVLSDPTLTRRPTDAVATYRETIAAGGVPADYVPVRRPAWCVFADLRTCLARPPVR
jgi:beta-glucosidase